MIVSPKKFQAIIIHRKNQKYNAQKLTIDEKVITFLKMLHYWVWNMTAKYVIKHFSSKNP